MGHLTAGARVARGGVSFAIAEQTAFWLVIALMLLLGVTMMIIAAWVYRSNDPEPEVLAPLDLMGKRSFREADPDAQQHQLDDARPAGATTLRTAVTVPRSRRRPTAAVAAASSATIADAADLEAEPGESETSADDQDHGTDAETDGDAADTSAKRRPRRYLAGDAPTRRRRGARRFEADDEADYDADDEHGVDDDDRAAADLDPYAPVEASADVDLIDEDLIDEDLIDEDLMDEVVIDADGDDNRVHRRSRLPFRVGGGESDPFDDDDYVSEDSDLDDHLAAAELADEDDEYLDDLDADADYDDVGQDGALVEVADAPTSAAALLVDDADDDDDDASADGDTWLDRAEREEPSGGFRRQRLPGGGRWRRRPAAAGADILAAEIDELDDVDVSTEQPIATGYDAYSNTQTDLEEEPQDMDFEHDDFDAYGDPANRPNAAADPFFEDDFDGEWNESTSPGRPRRRARRAAEAGTPTETPAPRRGPSAGMNTFDPDAMVDRFRERAAAVRRRPLPPVAGEERQEFIQQAKIDYQDFAMIGDAEVTIEDGVLVLRVDLRG